MFIIKKTHIFLLLLLMSTFSGVHPASEELSSIKDRLHLLLDLSNMKRRERVLVRTKIEDLTEEVLEHQGIDVRTLSDYLEDVVPEEMVIHAYDYNVLKSKLSFKKKLLMGGGILALGTLSALVFPKFLNITLGAGTAILALVVYTAVIWVPLLLISFVAPNTFSFGGAPDHRYFLKMARYDLTNHLRMLEQQKIAVPEQLLTFHLTYIVQDQKFIENALSRGALVKDLVRAFTS